MSIGLDFGNTTCVACTIDKNGNTINLIDASYPFGYPTVFAYKNGEKHFGNDALNPRYDDYRIDLLKRELQKTHNGTKTLDGKDFKVSEIIADVMKNILDHVFTLYRHTTHNTDTDINLAYPAIFSPEDIMEYINVIRNIKLEDGTTVTVKSIICEPEAASLDYNYNFGNKETDEETSIVFDLGGGTIDVCSVVTYPKGRKTKDGKTYYSKTIVKNGDNIGGADFTKKLAELIKEKMKSERKFRGKTLPSDGMIVSEAERIKKELSDVKNNSGVTVNLTVDGEYSDSIITYDEFKKATAELVDTTVKLTREVYEETSKTNKVSRIVLVGGGSNMRNIKEALDSEFTSKNVTVEMHNPSFSIAYGAARYAQPVDTTRGEPERNTVNHISAVSRELAERIWNSQTKAFEMSVIVPRGADIPYNNENYIIFNTVDRTNRVDCSLYEAKTTSPDRTNENDYRKILDMHYTFKRYVPAGTRIEIRAELSANGDVKLFVRDYDKKKEITGTTSISLVNYKEASA